MPRGRIAALVVRLSALSYPAGKTYACGVAMLDFLQRDLQPKSDIFGRRTLEEVRRLLSDKLNAGDETAVYRVSFEKGIIQAMSRGHAESIGMPADAGNHAAGMGNGHLGPLDAPFTHPPDLPGPRLAN